MTDRTDDFFATAATMVSAGVQPVCDLPVGKKSPSEEARTFGKKAAEISKKIQLTSKRLMELANLTRSRGATTDGTDINTLAARLKNDTKFIKVELDHLQSYLNSNKEQVSHGSKNATSHSQNIIEAMQRQLLGTSSNFKTVLEEQQNIMQENKSRRGVLGRSNRMNLSARPASPALSDGLPRPDGVNKSLYGGIGDDGEPEGPLIQPVAQLQDDRYLSSRADAATTLETHISELGDVFSQLSIMISEQGSLVERVDENVQQTHDNINRGTEQLLQTWKNVSNNKWLAAKIMGILLFFMTFFVIFLV